MTDERRVNWMAAAIIFLSMLGTLLLPIAGVGWYIVGVAWGIYGTLMVDWVLDYV